ncbi:MAG: VWA domain-containing protein [Deltaproteobacteria bacterium]|nr:VWA domain-containing protein [Nannocystaceae bacterium]
MRRHAPLPEDPTLPVPRRRPRSIHAIETVLLASTACLLAAVAWPIATRGLVEPSPSAPAIALEPVTTTPAEAPVIQIALLLDTSSSMDGLIDQARTRLWTVVNSLDSATFHGAKPRFEVALYEYGNDDLSEHGGFVRQVVGFTPELDTVSQALFALSTNGGSEFAPQAVSHALGELSWKRGEGVMRVVYVAGNESFQQGPVAWEAAIDNAREHGIVVNTVFCGGSSEYHSAEWHDVAERSGGRAFSIDQNAAQAFVASPFDADITELGTAINHTYVGYGAKGADGIANQVEQDNNNEASGASSYVQRSMSKSSGWYRNPSWDLVDAVEEGVVELDAVDRDQLPADLRGLDGTELAAFVASRKAERGAIAAKLAELRSEREAWLAAQPQADDGPAGLDRAMVEAITAQAEASGFTLGTS